MQPPEVPFTLPELSVYVDNPDAVRAACNSGAGRVYYEVPAGKAKEIRNLINEAGRVCGSAEVELIWKWPRIADQEFIDQAIPLLSKARESGIGGVMVEGLGLAEAIAGQAPGLRIFGGQGLNITNYLSIEVFSTAFAGLTLSPELAAEDLSHMVAMSGRLQNKPGLEIMVQGSQEAMVSEDDLLSGCRVNPDKVAFHGLLDETGRLFPVYRDAQGRTHLSNAVETCMVDHLPFIAGAGIDRVAIDARRRGAYYAGDMTLAYREALGVLQTGRGEETKRGLLQVKERIKKMSMGGITTGALFQRGAEDPGQ